jgi:hypothetical protein
MKMPLRPALEAAAGHQIATLAQPGHHRQNHPEPRLYSFSTFISFLGSDAISVINLS